MDNFELDSANNALQSSPTAYDNSQAPSSSDISAQIRQMSLKASLDKANSDRLKQRWYGTKQATTEGQAAPESPGLLSRGLNALQAPAHALVGAAKYVAGKSDKGFVDTVNENMGMHGEGWSGFLESVGSPRSVSVPLGIAMDFALDPVMWMSAGTEALVPRVAVGLKEGGLEGAKLAVQSSALRKASKLASYIPGLRNPGGEAGNIVKIAGEALGSGDEALVKAAKGLEWPLRLRARVSQMGDKAVELAQQYDTVTGRNLMADLDKVAEKGMYGVKPTQALEKFLKENTTWGEDFISKVKYSPSEWYEKRKRLEEVEKGVSKNLLEPLGFKRTEGGIEATTKTRDAILNDLDQIGNPQVINTHGNPEDVVMAQRKLRDLESIEAAPTDQLERLDDVVREFKNVPPEGRPIASAYSQVAEKGAALIRGGQAKVPNNTEELMSFFEQAGADEEAIQVAKSMLAKTAEASQETGIKTYDTAMQKLQNAWKVKIKGKEVSIVGKALDHLNLFNKIFALAKVPLSPGAYTNAVVGNPIMAKLFGVPILNPEYFSSIMQAFKFGRGLRDPAFLEALAEHGGDLAKFQEKYGETARQVLGTGLNTLAQSHLIDAAIDVAAASGKTLTKEEIITALKQLAEESGKAAEGVQKAKKAAVSAEDILLETAMKTKGPKPQTAIGWMEKGGFSNVKKADLPNTWFAQEVGTGDFAKILDKMKAKGDAGSEIYKALYKAATVPSTWYSSIDEAYKLGTFKFLVSHGLNAEELAKMNRFANFGSEGVASTIKANGELRYLLSPDAALKGVNEMYMQYAAMPAAVQMLRSIPIIGSPFVSFPYAMSSKLVKTLAYNPGAFNEVGHVLNAFGGRKTPLEKQAIATKYQFLDKPGVVRIPFFDEHPVYANLTNMIPYYSMNMLMPSERRFRDSWAGGVSEVVDKSPLFKGPVGQMLVDEMLLPLLAGEGEAPQGYFGQPIWPTDATGLEKAGYAARNLGESVVPGVLGLAGALNPAMPKTLQSQTAIQMVPSFRYRSLAEATQGKNALGIQGMEPAFQRTMRGILSTAGLSTTPVNLDKTNTD